ncbi:hypothetical protein ACEPAH_956 [Sanghuangporus vaninii]
MSSSLIDQAIASLGRAQTVNYANVICAALIAYDYLLTLPDEIRLIWPAKWNAGKIMFFLTRYPVFVDTSLTIVNLIQPNVKLSLCKPIYQAAAWMSFAGITIAEIIMMMRVYAIWGAKKQVLIFLVIFNLGIIIPDIVLLERSLRSLVYEFMPSPFPTLAPCVLIDADLSVYIDFILIMVSEFVVIVMTVWKCFSEWRARRSSLMKALLEDGVQYFVCMFAISFANLLVVKTAVVDFSGLLFLIQRVLHAILSARILMHIREVVRPEADVEVSDMSFADAPNAKNQQSIANSLSQMDFGEQQSSGTFGGTNSQIQSMESRPGFFKSLKAGPLNGVHITRGTIADEELHQVIGGSGTELAEKRVFDFRLQG